MENQSGELNSQEVVDAQHASLQDMDPNLIPSGCYVPIEMIIKFSQPGEYILNVGCGTGTKVMALAVAYPDREVIGVDFNSKAIRKARKSNQLVNADFISGDVTNYEGLLKALGDRRPSVIVAEGLFANLIGIDAMKAIMVINQVLPTGGHLLVADCLRADSLEGVEIMSLDEFKGDFEKYIAWMTLWETVYRENKLLFGPLEQATFVVFDPKKKDRWTYDFDHIYQLWWDKNYERIARHWDREILELLIQTEGFNPLEDYLTIWHGRARDPILGYVGMFRKNLDISEINGMMTPDEREYYGILSAVYRYERRLKLFEQRYRKK